MNFKSDQFDGINSAFAARDPRLDCKLDYPSLSRSPARPPPAADAPFLFPPGPPVSSTFYLSLVFSRFLRADGHVSASDSKLNGALARNKGAADAPHLHNKSGDRRIRNLKQTLPPVPVRSAVRYEARGNRGREDRRTALRANWRLSIVLASRRAGFLQVSAGLIFDSFISCSSLFDATSIRNSFFSFGNSVV